MVRKWGEGCDPEYAIMERRSLSIYCASSLEPEGKGVQGGVGGFALMMRAKGAAAVDMMPNTRTCIAAAVIGVRLRSRMPRTYIPNF